jgi:hypothetical protein
MNKNEIRIRRRLLVLARRRLSERPDDLERVLQLLAGRRGRGLVRRLATLWGEEQRPSFYDAELLAMIDEWAPPRDAAKPRVPTSGKRWTSELLTEMKKYRETHGTKATGQMYGVSTALVRAKLPSRPARGN